MFLPYPSRSFPILGPFSVRDLIEDKKNDTSIIQSHFDDIPNLRAFPIWRIRDTPLRSIYRLYKLPLADCYELHGWETEYFFFRPDWTLQDIPEPQDSDPLRYTVIASIVEELYKAINWSIFRDHNQSHKHLQGYVCFKIYFFVGKR